MFACKNSKRLFTFCLFLGGQKGSSKLLPSHGLFPFSLTLCQFSELGCSSGSVGENAGKWGYMEISYRWVEGSYTPHTHLHIAMPPFKCRPCFNLDLTDGYLISRDLLHSLILVDTVHCQVFCTRSVFLHGFISERTVLENIHWIVALQ